MTPDPIAEPESIPNGSAGAAMIAAGIGLVSLRCVGGPGRGQLRRGPGLEPDRSGRPVEWQSGGWDARLVGELGYFREALGRSPDPLWPSTVGGLGVDRLRIRTNVSTDIRAVRALEHAAESERHHEVIVRVTGQRTIEPNPRSKSTRRFPCPDRKSPRRL